MGYGQRIPAAWAALAAGLFILSGPLLANITVAGSLPRGGTIHEFTFTLTMTGITPADAGIDNLDQSIKDNLTVKLSDHPDSDLPVRIDGTGRTDPFLSNYTLSVQSSEYEEQDSGNYTITTELKIHDGNISDSGSIANLLAANNNAINLKAEFDKLDGDPYESDTLTINRKTTVVNASPGTPTLKSLHKQIFVEWPATTGKVSYNGEDDTDYPTGVRVLWAKVSGAPYTLKGTVYNADQSAEVSGGTTCTVDPTADPCVTCTESGSTYLVVPESSGELAESRGVSISENFSRRTTGYRITSDDEDTDEDYLVFLMYEPEAVAFSGCATGSPGINYTLTEMNGGPEANLGDPACFIATAAYGTPRHNDLDILRSFRDRFLMSHAPGRILVQAYYKLSPPVAAWITTRPAAKEAVRTVLGPVIAAAALTLEHPFVLPGFFLLPLAALAAGLLLVGRTKDAQT